MSVIVGSARLNENGKITGGIPGDQTGREVGTQAWYMHTKGWIVLRAKTPAVPGGYCVRNGCRLQQ